jgi:IS605 OrfB family transposase
MITRKVDINPDRIAICFIASDGNRVWSRTLVATRMFHGSSNKTSYEIALLIKEIVSLALELGCAVAAENLKFRRKLVGGWRKFNRMKSRFVWRAFLTLLERKCRENGIEFLFQPKSPNLMKTQVFALSYVALVEKSKPCVHIGSGTLEIQRDV